MLRAALASTCLVLWLMLCLGCLRGWFGWFAYFVLLRVDCVLGVRVDLGLLVGVYVAVSGWFVVIVMTLLHSGVCYVLLVL